jgi:TetR/AcrR family transcriptional repressor of nem operon
MPPGRPRTFDPDAAIEDALGLFWRGGVRGTSTRALEARLGVRQASLYAAFGSKAGLAGLAMDRYVARIDAALLAPLREAPDGLAAVRRFIEDLERWLTADGMRGCMLGRTMSEGPAEPAVAERIAGYRRRLTGAIRAALARAAEAGEIDGATVTARADLLRAAVLGLNLAVVAGASREELRSMAAGVSDEVGRWT